DAAGAGGLRAQPGDGIDGKGRVARFITFYEIFRLYKRREDSYPVSDRLLFAFDPAAQRDRRLLVSLLARGGGGGVPARGGHADAAYGVAAGCDPHRPRAAPGRGLRAAAA